MPSTASILVSLKNDEKFAIQLKKESCELCSAFLSFQNLVSALLYYRPDDHITFLLQCLDRLQNGAIIYVPKLPPLSHVSTNISENKPNEKKALPPIGKQIDNSKVADNQSGLTRRKSLPPLPPQYKKASKYHRNLENDLAPHPPSLPKPRVLHRALLYRHQESNNSRKVNNNAVELEDEGQSKEKPKRKTRAEKREERKNKDKSKVQKVAEKNVKTEKESPEKAQNKLSRRENKRIKQRRKRKTDPLKRNFKTKWWLRQERLKKQQTSRRHCYEIEKDAEIHETEQSQILSYKEALAITWENKQKYAREQTMGSYSNLYALLKEFAPKNPCHQLGSLQCKKNIRKKRLNMKFMLCSGKKDIRKNKKWKGLVDMLMTGYIEEMEKRWNETSEDQSEDEEEDEDEHEMIEYLNRPFISLDERLIADCSPSFISRNYNALKTLCSIEMKSKQQVYLYQEKGYISGVGVSGSDKLKDKLNLASEYTKSKDQSGRRKQRIQDVKDIHMCVKEAAYKGRSKSSQDVIDYYIDL